MSDRPTVLAIVERNHCGFDPDKTFDDNSVDSLKMVEILLDISDVYGIDALDIDEEQDFPGTVQELECMVLTKLIPDYSKGG